MVILSLAFMVYGTFHSLSHTKTTCCREIDGFSLLTKTTAVAFKSKHTKMLILNCTYFAHMCGGVCEGRMCGGV